MSDLVCDNKRSRFCDGPTLIVSTKSCTICYRNTINSRLKSILVFICPNCNSANGDLDGTIDLVVSGGTAPYTYAWTGSGIDPVAQNQTGLGTGTYCVTVTDTNGCAQEKCWDLTEPEQLGITETIKQPTCHSLNGDLTGYIDIKVSGGTAPYTYRWTGPNIGANDQNQADLGTGQYDIVVTDAMGCTFSATYQLDEPEPISVIDEISELTCNSSETEVAEINIQVSGGNPPYSYNWSNDNGELVATTQNLEGQLIGTYCLEVADAVGCIWNSCYFLETNSIAVDAVVINGHLYGTIDLSVSGGTLPYTYMWTGRGVNPSSNYQSNLEQGEYCVYIIDAAGCRSDDYCWEISNKIEIDPLGFPRNDNGDLVSNCNELTNKEFDYGTLGWNICSQGTAVSANMSLDTNSELSGQNSLFDPLKITAFADIQIFPNPVQAELTFINPNTGELKITDLNGQTHKKLSHKRGTTKIDVSLLTNGLYFLHFTIDGQVHTERFIKL